MAIDVATLTAPAAWASALVNGDFSGLSDEEERACRAWIEQQAPYRVVSTVEDSERFTWHFRLHGGNAEGGDVVDYIAHKVEG